MRVLYVIDRPNLFGSEQHLFDILQYQKVGKEGGGRRFWIVRLCEMSRGLGDVYKRQV